MLTWVLHNGATAAQLGFIPAFFREDDPRPARDQINDRYSHGGGWQKFDGFSVTVDHESITYPGDPPYKALAGTVLRDEIIVVYQHSWVGIFQKDGSYEIARMD